MARRETAYHGISSALSPCARRFAAYGPATIRMRYIAGHPQYAAINRPRRFAFGEDCSGRSLWPKREWSPDRCCCPHFRGPGIEGSAKSRSEEHTSELQSLMRLSYAVFCLKKKKQNKA